MDFCLERPLEPQEILKAYSAAVSYAANTSSGCAHFETTDDTKKKPTRRQMLPFRIEARRRIMHNLGPSIPVSPFDVEAAIILCENIDRRLDGRSPKLASIEVAQAFAEEFEVGRKREDAIGEAEELWRVLYGDDVVREDLRVMVCRHKAGEVS